MIYDVVACGKRISKARHQLGLSQFELSEKLGVSPKYLSRIETGYQAPSLELMLLISKTLDEPLDMLIFGAYSYNISHRTQIKEKIQTILTQFSDILDII